MVVMAPDDGTINKALISNYLQTQPSPYEPGGRKFESCWAHHIESSTYKFSGFRSWILCLPSCVTGRLTELTGLEVLEFVDPSLERIGLGHRIRSRTADGKRDPGTFRSEQRRDGPQVPAGRQDIIYDT